MNQTIGYSKAKDPLTDKRLAKITGIRLDRLRVALKTVVAKGLFDHKPHDRFGYEHCIGNEFLNHHSDKIYPPFVPQNRTIIKNNRPRLRSKHRPFIVG